MKVAVQFTSYLNREFGNIFSGVVSNTSLGLRKLQKAKGFTQSNIQDRDISTERIKLSPMLQCNSYICYALYFGRDEIGPSTDES